ncbi:MAG: pirin family protein [Anaerolineae bacterium]
MNATSRTVRQIIEPQPVLEGAGVRLRRSFPGRSPDFPNPFLPFDHFGSDDPHDYMAGFPMHPHRGIETVTYMLTGAVAHRNSLGNAGVIGAGDVQWMTAGGGILHEEMPQQAPDGPMEGFQLWVNLPARLKMSRPRYQEFTADTIPQVTRPDGVTIRVIAGTAEGVTGPVREIAADPLYLDVAVPAGGGFAFPVTRGHTALAYVFRGAGAFGGAAIRAPKLLLFGDGDQVEVAAADQPVRFLLMSGKPANEPIVRYGPFVMNTREEILQALRNLQDGTFVR